MILDHYNFFVHGLFFLELKTLLGDVAKFTLYFTRILSELGQIHYMKSW